MDGPGDKFSVNVVSDTVVVFHINAMSADTVRNVRAELRCQMSNILMVVPVTHDVIPRLSQQVLADIAKLESSDVHIDIGNLSLLLYHCLQIARVVARSEKVKFLDF